MSQSALIIKPQSARRSEWKLAWSRFARNRKAFVCGLILVLLVCLCLGTLPVAWKMDYYKRQNLDMNRQGPSLWLGEKASMVSQTGLVESSSLNTFARNFAPFGFDLLGRNILWRCLMGGAVSLSIGIAAAFISMTVGTCWGAIAGWYGGRIDNLMMRIVDVLYGLPYILTIILLKMAFEPRLIDWFNQRCGPGYDQIASIVLLFMAIGSISWLTMARVIRGQVLSLKSMPYIEATRAMGLPTYRIILKHLLPNLTGPIIVYATLTVPQAILQESFLSFLGIGIQAPIPSWGSLASDAVKAINTVESFWWMVIFPCGMLGLTLLCLNFIGDGLRDAFDPKTVL